MDTIQFSSEKISGAFGVINFQTQLLEFHMFRFYMFAYEKFSIRK